MGVRVEDGMEVLRRRQKGDTRTEIGEKKKRVTEYSVPQSRLSDLIQVPKLRAPTLRARLTRV